MSDNEYLKRCLEVQRSFKELYGSGLVAVGYDYIQVNEEMFREMFPDGADRESDPKGGIILMYGDYNGMEIVAGRSEEKP